MLINDLLILTLQTKDTKYVEIRAHTGLPLERNNDIIRPLSYVLSV